MWPEPHFEKIMRDAMNVSIPENTTLFRSLTEAEREECLAALKAQEKAFARGDLLLHAGFRTDRMGLVLSGSVTIENNDLWGNCTILSHVGAGQLFAEAYALSQEVMLVDVRANEDCRVLFLNVACLRDEEDLSSWKGKLIRNLLGISSRKNLALSGRSFHTAPKSARGRLLAYLNTVALQKQSNEFDIPFDRQQLADYLNLERTNMSKELTRMKEDGLIECRKSHFKLLQ